MNEAGEPDLGLVEFQLYPAALLPPITGLTDSPCLLLGNAPTNGRGDCCWDHSVSWTDVLVESQGVLARYGNVLSCAQRDQAVTDCRGMASIRAGLFALLASSRIVLASPANQHYINGRHKSQAIKDQGVPFVLVEANPPLDPRVLAQIAREDAEFERAMTERDARREAHPQGFTAKLGLTSEPHEGIPPRRGA